MSRYVLSADIDKKYSVNDEINTLAYYGNFKLRYFKLIMYLFVNK